MVHLTHLSPLVAPAMNPRGVCGRDICLDLSLRSCGSNSSVRNRREGTSPAAPTRAFSPPPAIQVGLRPDGTPARLSPRTRTPLHPSRVPWVLAVTLVTSSMTQLCPSQHIPQPLGGGGGHMRRGCPPLWPQGTGPQGHGDALPPAGAGIRAQPLTWKAGLTRAHLIGFVGRALRPLGQSPSATPTDPASPQPPG